MRAITGAVVSSQVVTLVEAHEFLKGCCSFPDEYLTSSDCATYIVTLDDAIVDQHRFLRRCARRMRQQGAADLDAGGYEVQVVEDDERKLQVEEKNRGNLVPLDEEKKSKKKKKHSEEVVDDERKLQVEKNRVNLVPLVEEKKSKKKKKKHSEEVVGLKGVKQEERMVSLDGLKVAKQEPTDGNLDSEKKKKKKRGRGGDDDDVQEQEHKKKQRKESWE